MTLTEAINSKRETEERTIHLTKSEFDTLMRSKYDEGYNNGYKEGQNDKVKEVDEFYEDND